ncbi:MAG: DcaP family trimeric outer membrane transporter [Hyphomicrobiales bacterium]
MTNTKWLRRALLGGVALGVIATGARADELSDLKAQLEQLQSQVNTLQSQQPTAAASGSGLGSISWERGQGSLANWGQDIHDKSGNNPDTGFTVAITPTADMPAPVAEITVYGYVKGDVLWDMNGMTNKYSFSLQSLDPFNNGSGNAYVNLHALQSRFGIKSKVDTAVGQIRTRIEGDFFGSFQSSTYGLLRLRHAYGEWDMAPGWTLLVGQTDYLETMTIVGVDEVDFYGDAGPLGRSRTPQVRMTYTDGPLSWAVAMETPTFNSSTAVPNFAGAMTYNIPGGHTLQATAVVADYDVGNYSRSSRYDTLSADTCTGPDTGATPIGFDASGNAIYPAITDSCAVANGSTASPSGLGWAVNGGASFNLADVATFNVGGNFGQGEVVRELNQTYNKNQLVDANGDLMEAWSVQGGLSFGINEATTFNVGAGYEDYLGKLGSNGWIQDAVTVHANIMWQPVKQMKLGWEAMWGQINYANDGVCTGAPILNGNGKAVFEGGCETSADDVRLQFGAWFFF